MFENYILVALRWKYDIQDRKEKKNFCSVVAGTVKARTAAGV